MNIHFKNVLRRMEVVLVEQASAVAGFMGGRAVEYKMFILSMDRYYKMDVILTHSWTLTTGEFRNYWANPKQTKKRIVMYIILTWCHDEGIGVYFSCFYLIYI